MTTATMNGRAGNLPLELTSFVGRRSELAEIRRLLSARRLVTLTGSGGAGKSRLALRAATETRRAFPDGAWLVDLADVEGRRPLTLAVAETLGCRERSALPELVSYLRDRRLLLVLDNCEGLREDCVTLVGHLLRLAPGLRILVASRRVLGVAGEHVLDVPPLATPAADVPADLMTNYEAVRLFVERASAVVPGFCADDPAVAELCRRLDGLPLAIELAAAWTRVLSVRDMVERLDGGLGMLRRQCAVTPGRQESLRASIEWSHDLCSPEQRTLWARLSVFRGGFDLEAAEQVVSGDGLPAATVLEAAAGLVEHSILHRDARGGEVRYRMLETLRNFGGELLAGSGETQVLRQRHRDWCRALVTRAQTSWFGDRQTEWLARLRDERENVRAALEFCLEEPAEPRAAMEIAAAFWGRPLPSAHVDEGHEWLSRALALDPTPSAARAKALRADAWLGLLRGDHASAVRLLRQPGESPETLGDAADRACALGFAALIDQDLPRAMALSETALTRYRSADDQAGAWFALLQSATATVCAGDDRSTALCEECVRLCEDQDAPWSRSYGLWVSGVNRLRHRDIETATALIREALRVMSAHHDRLGIAHCVEALAWIAADDGRGERAARMLGAASALWRSAGISLNMLGHLARLHADRETRLRRDLGDAVFEHARGQGADLAPARAVEYALGDRSAESTGDPQEDTGIACALTRREREIAELVAQGLSNRQIAERLVIAQRTAEGHVEHVLRKLGFTSRTQIAALWAARRQSAGGR